MTFDYIVIGAGSSGAVIASRLSEDPGVRVALLEVGGEASHPLFRMPLAFPLAYQRFAWKTEGEPESGLLGRRAAVVGGEVLGGSSSVNGMVYSRGNAIDYDLWQQSGLDGWGYADVLPYFKRLENSWRGETSYHGGSGPIAVSRIDSAGGLYDVLELAAVAAGHQTSTDPYGAQVEGIGQLEATIARGRRSGTAVAYIDRARSRPNLKIITHARARRVLLEGRRATGVEYSQSGGIKTLACTREVIVSAGTIKSPQILMLSGIGPAAHLCETGVALTLDLPGVGQNLGEHPLFAMSWKASGDSFLRHLRYDRAALAALRWALVKSGPMATTICYAMLYASTRPGLLRPDVQLVATQLAHDAQPWFPMFTRRPVHVFGQMIMGLHPESRGWVRLCSSDPNEMPQVCYNLLSTPGEVETLVAAVRIARDIYSQSPQSELIERELQPGADLRSDAELAQFVRETSIAAIHHVGTCRMGRDEHSVVDAELRVHGIDGLRVADASVMPDVPGGNTNIPAIMIGEKAADLIRGRRLPPADLPAAA
jgi:choline dehydrogenase